MKKKPASKSAFFNQRFLIGFSFCLIGLVLALLAFAAYPGGKAFARQEQAVVAAPAVVEQSAAAPEALGTAKNFPSIDLLTPEQVNARDSRLAEAPDQASCSLTVLPTDGSSSANARAPSTRFAASRAHYLITATELAAAGFPNGTTPTFLGWTYFAAPVTGGSAPLTILMQNTTDTTNTKSLTWATAITGMTTVHSAVTALPGTIGPFDIPFTGGSSFTYTGGGLYIAYDWGNYAGTLSTTSSVSTNTALINGLASANSAAATVVSSNFRPETRLSSFAANNAAVQFVRGFGELPRGLVPAQIVSGVIANHGSSALTNLPVTLNLTGANTFTNGQSIASLASCTGQGIATFSGFTPANAGANTLTVSVPADDVAGDNTLSRPLTVTSVDYSYKHPGTTANGGVGVNGATAALVARFNTLAANAVTAVKLEFPNAVPTTAFRVAIYAESAPGSGTPATAPIFVDAADRPGPAAGPVTITLPAAVPVGPGNFFVGIQQTNNVNVGLSFDTENPIRSGSFFLAIPNGTAFFDAAPGNNFKLNIGLILQTPGPTPTATATATASATSTVAPTSTPSPSVTPATPSPTASASASASASPTCAPGLTEAFDDITTLPGAGWVQTNHSTTIGTTGWFQGNSAVFPAHLGGPTAYIGANFNNTTGTNTISNWLLTPTQTLQNGLQMTFWTRTTTANPFPDRLQVRMSTAGASTNVGVTSTDVGDFTTVLLDINPTYTVGGYPEVWTQQTVTVTGVPAATLGRLAFRYFVENGGPTGANSNYIGIDTVAIGGCGGPSPTPGTPSPSVSASPSGTPSPSPSVSPGGCSLINGGLNPQPLTESGVAAPAGFFWSEVQHDAGNNTVANTNAGYADFQGTTRLADDFTLAQACTINNVVFYGYLTGAPATPSPFTAYTLQIWNGRPGDPGAVVVFGDTTTNRLVSSTDSTFFRIFNTVVPPPGTVQGTTRKIWRNTVNVGGLALPAGHYWVDWASTVTGAVNHFAPAKTIPGARGAAGDNARQFTAGAWVDVVDAGVPATPPSVPQDFPFEVNGLPLGGTPSPSPTPTTSPTPSATPSPCGVSTFTNSTNIVVPAGAPGVTQGAATPYPSNITVAGTTGTITKVTVNLNGLTSTFPGDIDLLLVGPGGQSAVIMSDVGGGTDVTSINLTLDDAAAANMSGTTIASGTFKPTNLVGVAPEPDTWPAPAPAPPAGGASALSAFNGTSANGTWNLYVFDDAAADVHNFGGGWSLNISTTTGVCVTPTPSATLSPGTPSPSPSCPPGTTQGFDDIAGLPALGWVQTNHSTTIGTTGWFQGNDAVFPAHQGTLPNSYIGANFNNTTGTNTISNWLLTPAQTLQDGVQMTFWTRTTTANPFPDRLQVRMSTAGNSTNVGTTATDVGDFTTLLLDINPTYTVGGYPEVWTQQTVTITGVPAATLGRLAFRYFVENGGPTGDNSNYIGIDTFAITGACPSPSPSATPTSTIAPPSATPTATSTIGPGTPTPTATATATAPGGSPTATPGISPSTQAVNISTRMRVQTGDRVGIGGFIITGGPKQVLVRAIGPSLTRYMITDVLADPFLELHGPTGFTTLTNDNWRVPNGAAIQATGLPPTNDLESAILTTLNPGAYTAIIKGVGNTSGVGLVEVYDLDPSSGNLANISTRAFVATADNIVIAGFVLGESSAKGVSDLDGAAVPDSLIIRGIGPSLTAAGVTSVLADPTLELRDSNGSLLISNNDWQDNPTQAAIIAASGLAPSNNLEAAIAATLPPGLYTALLAGLNNTTGNGLVEVYDRGAGGGPVPSPTPPGVSPTPPGGTPSPTPPGVTPSPTPPGATPSPTPPAPTPTPSAGPTTCTEDFDGVAAPALPAGWTAELTTGDPPTWVTTTTTSDSAPNNAFVPDQDGISEKRLVSRSITINSAAAVMSFRNNYITEYDPPPAEVFWDGYVADVSTDGGTTWNDIISAGGTFVSGPYNGEIDGTANNPLAGRQAWCGNSGGYINSVINLPASFNGQTIKIRFVMGSDEAVAATGVHLDGLSITGASCP